MSRSANATPPPLVLRETPVPPDCVTIGVAEVHRPARSGVRTWMPMPVGFVMLVASVASLTVRLPLTKFRSTPMPMLLVESRLLSTMASGVRLAALKPKTWKVTLPVAVTSPLVEVIVPVLLVDCRARWPESGEMSRSPKVTPPALVFMKTPVPPDWLAVVLPKFIVPPALVF